jgi:hypothetical protein
MVDGQSRLMPIPSNPFSLLYAGSRIALQNMMIVGELYIHANG